MPYIPDHVCISNAYILLVIILYQVGILSNFLFAVDNGDIAFDEEDHDGCVISLCKFICRPDFCLGKHNFITTNPEGRITFLRFDNNNPYNKVDSKDKLPPIIGRLQKLEAIDLYYCELIPIELGNLPLLKRIRFSFCSYTFNFV